MILGRLALVLTFALGILFAPLAAEAQQARKISRIGYLVVTGAGTSLREGLRALGYVEGRSIVIEMRSADGRADQLPALATELVRLNVDVIVAGGPEAVEAARKATSSIPIVMVALSDPVAAGLVASFARPGGNLTGLTGSHPEVAGKRLELLKEAAPGLSRVAVLWDPSADPAQLREAEAAARAIGLRLQVLVVRAPTDFEAAFQAAARERAQALHVTETALLIFHRVRLAELAARAHLPAIGMFRLSPQAGFLMSYGPDMSDLFRRAATYVDKILKGAKPGDLPIERPDKFELVVNMKTARALGLTIPQSLLLRVDHVIE
jgi:putative ABC transport system substrate-binding protein